MSDSAFQRLHLPRNSLVHRLPAHVKLLAALSFVLIVVATPRTLVWAFFGYAVLLIATATAARLPLRVLARRLIVEVPFVIFAVALPFLTPGNRVQFLGMQLSEPGLWSAWNILAKATLGVGTSVLLAATTDLPEILTGLQRLHMPALLVQVMSFMARYTDVVLGEWRRMHIARTSRGFVARDVRALPVLANSTGTLFIRSYERGERVHLAMLSRGYTGTMPQLTAGTVSRRDWFTAAALPLGAALVLAAAMMVP